VIKKHMLRCEKCGKEYSYGRKIHHECDGNLITHGVIFESSTMSHGWNCLSDDSDICDIEERAIASYVSNSKVSSLFTYE
jgi:hypothetical protein